MQRRDDWPGPAYWTALPAARLVGLNRQRRELEPAILSYLRADLILRSSGHHHSLALTALELRQELCPPDPLQTEQNCPEPLQVLYTSARIPITHLI